MEMRRTLALVAVVAGAMSVAAPAVAGSQQMNWTEASPLSGTIDGSDLVLDIAEAGTYPIVAVDHPAVGPPRFSVDATIRYSDVIGGAYLEMWTVLDDGSRYFTRTLADAGPLALMTGTSDPRPISLPFELGEEGPTPARLEINLVTSGRGKFWLGPLRFLAEAPVTSTTGATETTAAPITAPPTTATAPVTAAPTATTTPSATTDSQPAASEGRGGVQAVLVAVVAGAAGLSAYAVARNRRRRQAAEQRRMDAIDSMKGPRL
jgi:hypothetical protein